MDASVPIISLSFRQTTLRQACNNVRCSLPRQTGNAFPAGNGIKHRLPFFVSKSLWRKERDSNPRSLAAQRFSRPPQSTTLPSFRTQKYNLFSTYPNRRPDGTAPFRSHTDGLSPHDAAPPAAQPGPVLRHVNGLYLRTAPQAQPLA